MLYIIANAKSGNGRCAKVMKKVRAYCEKADVPLSFLVTERVGHASELAGSITLHEGDKLAVLGGDGTFHEVMQGLHDPAATPLGFIPAGRGNDFIRSAGVPKDPIKALKAIINGKLRNLDYIEVGGKRCLNIAGTGLDVDVLERTMNAKNKFTYLKSLIQCLRSFESTHVTLKTGGESHEFDCVMVGVCNGKYFGGNMCLAPLAEVDDGKLEVIVITMPENGKIMRILPKFVRGKHMDMPITKRFICEEVNIGTEKPVEIDGEIYKGLAFDCRIVKGGLLTYDAREQND